ncbi:MAG: RelA/SpoT domain-containing protein [Alphaproteobacteria bacterium]|nr:RelA/SpoT domain-containing protein [Alphaproteobacteria bacterium]
MKIAEYEAGGREQYERLACLVRGILADATDGIESVGVLQIQHRSKAVVSLKKKMAARGLSDRDELERSIKDLAGCRIILYTNSDVERLLQSSIIRENFQIDWDRTKIHYPFDETDPGQLFVSYNYVLKLNDAHVAQPEHADLAALYCEVQVQTILDHAWSEMAHDTTYKSPVAGFGTKRMEGIRKRMTEIMNKYLLPAGFDFQKVAEDVAELRAAQDLHDREPLKLLTDATSNEERIDLLQSFQDLMLPHYDDLPAIAPRIRETLMSVVAAARAAEDAEDEPKGSYRYGSVSSIVDKTCDIFDALRFMNEDAVAATFDCLLQLHVDANDEDQRKRILTSVEHLAEHNLQIWQARGPLVQQLLMDRIGTLTETEAGDGRRIVVETLQQILKPEVTGTTSSFDAVTFRQGSVAASADLEAIRSAAISKLEDMFDHAIDDGERARLVQTLHAGTRLAHQGETKVDTFAMIVRTAARFVRFFVERWDGLAFELRQKVEHKALWLHKHRALPADFSGDEGAKAAIAELVQEIAALRAVADLDPDYVIFKTLVGFDEVLKPYWDGDPFDKTFRESEIDRLVEEIDVSSIEHWRGRIERCAVSQSNDGAYYIYFSRLLRELARQKPDLAMTLLEKPSPKLAEFLDDLLFGFETSQRSDDVMQIVDGWIAGRKYLSAIARYLWRPQRFDGKRLERTFDAAVGGIDSQAAFDCLRSGAEHVLDHPDLLQTVILPAISYLVDRGVSRWVEQVVFGKGGLKCMMALSAAEADLILEALVVSPAISHWEEEVLARITNSYHQKFVDFIEKRLEVGAADDVAIKYEAIPFEFHVLPEHIEGMADMLVSAGRRWFGANDQLFQFRGGAAIARLFPKTADIEAVLDRYIASGDRSDLEFVVDVLRAYFSGASSNSSICRDIVARLASDDPLLVEVGIIIEQSGVLSGEFGGVEAKAAKRDYMRSWLTDPREAVR